jgi:hypothetical protein
MTSPDGITWTSRTSAADNAWQSVCYGNGLFVAVSGNGSMTSGKTFTNEISNNNIYQGGMTIYGAVNIKDSMIIGSPTGGDKGSGTINAVAVYDDNVLLTKYALDYYLSDSFDKSLYINEKVAVDRFVLYADMCKNLDEYNKYVINNKVLPTFADIELKGERPSVGELGQRCWEELEIKTIHIMQLNDKIKILEEKLEKLENK